MTYLSLFAGIGGGDVACDRAGMKCVGQVEIDPFCRRVLERHWPDVPRVEDVREVRGDEFGPFDLCIFGSPCQDLSIAGRRAGLRGERSGLFFEAVRILERAAPRWIVFENVPGLLSSNGGRDFLAVLDALGQLRYGVAGCVLDAQYFGVPQRRRRVFVVGCLGDPERAGAVLSEPQGGAGDSPTRRTAGSDVAGTLGGGSGNRGWCDDLDRSGAFVPVAHALTHARSGMRFDPSEEDFVVVDPLAASYAKHGGASAGKDSRARSIIPTLRTNWRNNSNGGTEAQMLVAAPLSAASSTRGQPGDRWREDDVNLVPFVKRGRPRHADDDETWTAGGVSPTLNGWDTGEVRASAVVAHALTSEGHDASEDGTGRGTPLVHVCRHGSMACPQCDGVLDVDDEPRIVQEAQSGIRTYATAGTLRSDAPGTQPTGSLLMHRGVRRLTPTECERLQGFPDGWTCLCGAGGDMAACRCPDSPRYRSLGNAMAVPVVQWIAERIVAAQEVSS